MLLDRKGRSCRSDGITSDENQEVLVPVFIYWLKVYGFLIGQKTTAKLHISPLAYKQGWSGRTKAAEPGHSRHIFDV